MIYNTSLIKVVPSDQTLCDVVHLNSGLVAACKDHRGQPQLRKVKRGDFVLLDDHYCAVMLNYNLREEEIGISDQHLKSLAEANKQGQKVSWTLAPEGTCLMQRAKFRLNHFRRVATKDSSSDAQSSDDETSDSEEDDEEPTDKGRISLEQIRDAMHECESQLLFQFGTPIRIRVDGIEFGCSLIKCMAREEITMGPYRIDWRTEIDFEIKPRCEEAILQKDLNRNRYADDD